MPTPRGELLQRFGGALTNKVFNSSGSGDFTAYTVPSGHTLFLQSLQLTDTTTAAIFGQFRDGTTSADPAFEGFHCPLNETAIYRWDIPYQITAGVRVDLGVASTVTCSGSGILVKNDHPAMAAFRRVYPRTNGGLVANGTKTTDAALLAADGDGRDYYVTRISVSGRTGAQMAYIRSGGASGTIIFGAALTNDYRTYEMNFASPIKVSSLYWDSVSGGSATTVNVHGWAA